MKACELAETELVLANASFRPRRKWPPRSGPKMEVTLNKMSQYLDLEEGRDVFRFFSEQDKVCLRM